MKSSFHFPGGDFAFREHFFRPIPNRRSWGLGVFFSLVLSLLHSSCQQDINRTHLLGSSWKIDSIYRFYNGFEQRAFGEADDPTYQYLSGGKVREQKGQDYQEYLLRWIEPDTLLYQAPDGAEIGRYQVLQLKPDRLVLKRQKPFIFSGKGQSRYEIRYFSRKVSAP
jgi:hypothetical protein